MASKTADTGQNSGPQQEAAKARKRGVRRQTTATPRKPADVRPRKPPAPKKKPVTADTSESISALQIKAFCDLPVSVAVFDANNMLIAANALFVEAFELDPNIVSAGRTVDELVQYTVKVDMFEDFSNVTSLAYNVAQLQPGEISRSTLSFRDGRRLGQTVRKLDDGNWLAVYFDATEVVNAEKQARDAETRWNFALESARQGVWDSNLETGEIFYSHMWRVLRGLEDCDESELTAEAWRKRLHPDDLERVIEAIERQDSGERRDIGIEYRERHRDGHWIWILSRGRAVAWGQDGKPTRIIGTDTDVTETRSTQAALVEAEARWNFALRGTGQGVWDCNIPTKKMYYSPTWREMRGFGPNEEINDSPEAWLERVHPDDRERVRETIQKQDRGEIQSNSFEYRERHRDGHYVWIQSRGEPVAWDAEGRPTRTIGIDTDITVQKELELKAKESLTLLNTTLDNFPGGICMYDKDLILTVANQGFYEVMEVDEDWFPVGSKMEDILRLHAERGEYGEVDVESYVAQRIADALTFTPSEYTRTRPSDGVTLEIKRTPLDMGGYVMTFEDVSARIQAEADRAILEKELTQAQRLESLGTLASGIAHEINTPVQYVGDNIQFIAQSLRDLLEILQYCRRSMRLPVDPGMIAERAEVLAEMERRLDLAFLFEEIPLALEQSAQGVKQVARIVRAIKEFSHPGQEEMTEFDLNAIIETTLIVSKNQWKYFAEIETDLDRSLPLINCLPGEIGQVLLNLVVNAAHAIETAHPERGVIRVSTHRRGESAVVEIEDNGCGIPDAIRARVFDPFFTTKDIGKGTGQGLSLVFNTIVKKHGGTIDFISHEGSGTTFTISLPIGRHEDTQTEAA